MEHYNRYSPEQLALDKYFQEWVIAPNNRSNRDWLDFLQLHPDKRSTVDEAIELVKLTGLTSDESFNTAYLEGWHNIAQNSKQKTRRLVLMRVTAAAAAVTFIGLITYFVQFQSASPESFSTGYGEIKKISLKDGSTITLNANSSLRVEGGNLSNGERTVTVKGDAFFEVQHTPDNAPFIVLSSHGVKVVVLGTSFNVNDRNDAVQVYLKSGSIQLTANNDENILRPGQRATYSVSGNTLSINQVPEADANNLLAWLNNQYVMNDRPLSVIAGDIEATFGKKVLLDDISLADKRVTAKVPANDLNVLIEVVSQALDLKVEEKDNRLYIRKAR